VDGVDADELAPVVIDVGVRREGGGGPVDIAGVDRFDVFGDDSRQGNVFRGLLSDNCSCYRSLCGWSHTPKLATTCRLSMSL
jgi:hypothetical protein